MTNFKEKMLKCGFTDYYPAQTNRTETVDRPFHTRFSGTYVVKVERCRWRPQCPNLYYLWNFYRDVPVRSSFIYKK